jgi:hypothetical protein
MLLGLWLYDLRAISLSAVLCLAGGGLVLYGIDRQVEREAHRHG